MSQGTNCMCDDCRLANGEPPCPTPACERPVHRGPHKRYDEQRGSVSWLGDEEEA